MGESEDQVVVSRAEWEEMQRWRAEVTARLAMDAVVAAPPEQGEAPAPSVGRRRAVGALAGAAAGVVAGVVAGGGSPAAAANGGPVLLGQTNTATSSTEITGTYGDRAVLQALNAGSSTAIYGRIGSPTGQSVSAAVLGDSAGTTGVSGLSTTSSGVYGRRGDATSRAVAGAVVGDSATGPGVVAFSNDAAGVVASSVNSYGVDASTSLGVGVHGHAVTGTGVLGQASVVGTGVIGYSAAGTGVEGTSWQSASIGVTAAAVKGSAKTAPGVAGVSDEAQGVLGVSGTSYGVDARSPKAQLYLTTFDPRPAPLGETGHLAGEIVRDSNGDFWACVAADRWRKLVGPASAGAFHLLPVPVRVYDSRPGTVPTQAPKTPLPSGYAARTIDCKHNGSGVPAGATGVVLTVLLANATTGSGNLTVWAADKAKPLSNTMVWGGDAGRFTATAFSALDPQARVKIDANLQTNVILDVVGYYR